MAAAILERDNTIVRAPIHTIGSSRSVRASGWLVISFDQPAVYQAFMRYIAVLLRAVAAGAEYIYSLYILFQLLCYEDMCGVWRRKMRVRAMFKAPAA